MNIKKYFVNFIKKFDIRVEKISSNPKFEQLLVSALKRNNIDLVLDCGANRGQFADILIKNSYEKKLISFEPLSLAHNELLTRSKKNSNWKIYERCALGNFNGSSYINISNYEQSSSMLSMKQLHLDAKPNSFYKGKEAVKVLKLDSIYNEISEGFKKIFLKIDTQGYEKEILDGAKNSLDKLSGIMVEVSLVELYANDNNHNKSINGGFSNNWIDLILQIQKEGFNLWLLERGFSDPNTSKTLQMDLVFFR
jgi:FkbM family methyltransferase